MTDSAIVAILDYSDAMALEFSLRARGVRAEIIAESDLDAVAAPFLVVAEGTARLRARLDDPKQIAGTSTTATRIIWVGGEAPKDSRVVLRRDASIDEIVQVTIAAVRGEPPPPPPPGSELDAWVADETMSIAAAWSGAFVRPSVDIALPNDPNLALSEEARPPSRDRSNEAETLSSLLAAADRRLFPDEPPSVFVHGPRIDDPEILVPLELIRSLRYAEDVDEHGELTQLTQLPSVARPLPLTPRGGTPRGADPQLGAATPHPPSADTPAGRATLPPLPARVSTPRPLARDSAHGDDRSSRSAAAARTDLHARIDEHLASPDGAVGTHATPSSLPARDARDREPSAVSRSKPRSGSAEAGSSPATSVTEPPAAEQTTAFAAIYEVARARGDALLVLEAGDTAVTLQVVEGDVIWHLTGPFWQVLPELERDSNITLVADVSSALDKRAASGELTLFERDRIVARAERSLLLRVLQSPALRVRRERLDRKALSSRPSSLSRRTLAYWLMEAARSLPQERVRIALANREYVLSREADHVLAEAGIEFEVSSLLRRNDGLPVVLLESSTPSQLGVGGIVWCLGELGAVTLRDTTHRAYGGAQRPLATARRLAALEPQCTYLDVFEASASLREREQRFRDLNLELDVVASNEEDARMLRAAKALLDEAWFVASHDAEWNAYVAARAKRA